MTSRQLTIALSALAGRVQALHEGAQERPLKLLERDFGELKDAIESIVVLAEREPGFDPVPHSDCIRDAAYHLYGTYLVLEARVSRRHTLLELGRTVSKVFDQVFLVLFQSAPAGALLELVAKARDVAQDARVRVLPSDIRTPRIGASAILRKSGAKRLASESTLLDAQPKRPPSVPLKNRTEAAGTARGAEKISWKAPPPVLGKYRGERVGPRVRSRSSDK